MPKRLANLSKKHIVIIGFVAILIITGTRIPFATEAGYDYADPKAGLCSSTTLDLNNPTVDQVYTHHLLLGQKIRYDIATAKLGHGLGSCAPYVQHKLYL